MDIDFLLHDHLHQPACRGQRCALPTAPTFAHKLHSLPPLFLFLQFKDTRLKHGIVTLDLALARAAELEDAADAARAAAWIHRLSGTV